MHWQCLINLHDWKTHNYTMINGVLYKIEVCNRKGCGKVRTVKV